MTTYRMLLRLGVGVGLIVAMALWAGTRAHAIIIINSKTAQFGPFGVARGQTARINIANIGNPDLIPSSEVPPGPCRVTVGFTDANGMRLAERAMVIDGGKSAFLDLRVPPPDGDRTARGARVQLRASVDAYPPDPGMPEPTCVATVEVFDSNTGQTTLFIGNPDLMPSALPR